MTKISYKIGLARGLGAVLLLTLIACADLSAQSGSEEGRRLRIGYFVDRANEADPDSVRTSLTRWGNSVSPDKATRVTAMVETNPRRWMESIRNGSYDLYGLYTYQLLELDDASLLRPALSTEGDHGVMSTFLLITRKEDHYKSIASLRDKKIIIDTGGVGELPLIWLATRIAAATSAADIPGFANITTVQNPVRALFPVYFGKADACVVTRSAFADASLGNSEILKKLRESGHSKPLLVSVFAFHRDYPIVPAGKIIGSATVSNDERVSRDLFEMVNRKGIIGFDEPSLASVTSLYHEYKSLFEADAEAEEETR